MIFLTVVWNNISAWFIRRFVYPYNKWRSSITRFIDRYYSLIKSFTTIYTLVFTVLVAFTKSHLLENISAGIQFLKDRRVEENLLSYNYLNDGRSLDYYSFLLVIGTLFWLWCVFRIFFHEHQKTIQNFERVEAAIHNCPDLNVFDTHPITFEEVQRKLVIAGLYASSNDKSSEEILNSYNQTFQSILRKLCEITNFFQSKKTASYGGNIMIYVENDGSPEIHNLIKYIKSTDYEKKDDRIKTEFLHFKDRDVESFAGILHMVSGLVATNDMGNLVQSNINAPLVSIPVLKEVEGQTYLVLPGAANAVIDGESIFDDSSKLNEYYADFSKTTKGEADKFFNKQGRHIKSFVSIAVPRLLVSEGEGSVVGVVNIDCNRPHIIGRDKNYYHTYYSLVKPIVALLSEHLELYMQHYLNYLKERNLY